MQSNLDTALHEAGEEDSIFVSLADLFSLLSLTVIYVVLTFGQTVPSTSIEPVVSATLEGSGPGKPIDPNDIYVSLQSSATGVTFIVVRNGVELHQEIALDSGRPQIPEQWLLSVLTAFTKEAGRGTIFLYLAPNENNVTVEALCFDTLRFLKANFTNLQVVAL
jgi:hypothetical protein